MSAPNEIFLDFAKLVIGAFIGILNLWVIFVVTDIKNDVRQLRDWIVHKLTPHGEPTNYPHKKEKQTDLR